MKINEKTLRKLIRESIQDVLSENWKTLSIKWTGNDKLIPEILDSLKKYKKDIVIRLDGPTYIKKINQFYKQEEVIFIPKIQKLKYGEIIEEPEDEYYSNYTLNVDTDEYTIQFLLKLFYRISMIGDCGHTFTICINNKEFIGWDGDGSDRIISINGNKKWKEIYEN
jgi:hypothetical protein